jgi:hypothetical protein
MRIQPRPAAASQLSLPSADFRPPPGWDSLSIEIRQRLAGFGIHSIGGWRKLTRAERGQLFGITTRTVLMLDAIAGRWPR